MKRGEVHEVEEDDDEKEDEEEDEEVEDEEVEEEEEEEVQWHRSSSASGFSFYYDPWSLHACLATRQQVSDDDDDDDDDDITIQVLYADDGGDGGDDDSDDGDDGDSKPQSLHAQLVAYEWVSHLVWCKVIKEI